MSSNLASDFYKPPWYLFNKHLETIIPYVTYTIRKVPYVRERIELADGDFLDLDWVRNENPRLLVICHGYEGNTRDTFVERAAKYFSNQGYDILMWHYRSCSDEPNRLPRFYHVGDTSDLDAVIRHGLKEGYCHIYLVGFSMGGSMVVNYLGQKFDHRAIKGAAVFSAPLDFQELGDQLRRPFNYPYRNSFMSKWKERIKRKAVLFPDLFDLEKLGEIDTLERLYETYLLQFMGADSLKDYFFMHNSLIFLRKIQKPLLLINAQNDPLLATNSYPKELQENIHTIYPENGGHLGFYLHGEDHSWLELKAHQFFLDIS